MNKKLKCAICSSVVGIFLFINANPIYEECLKRIKETLHTVEIQSPINSTGPDRNSGIEITGTPTAVTISTSSSSSSSSSTSSSLTATQPPEVV